MCAMWATCKPNSTCSGNGACAEDGSCVCQPGWGGLDCSIVLSAVAWADEFEGSVLDTSSWHVYSGCCRGGTGEEQCYTRASDNVFVQDGTLVLQAVREDYQGTEFECDDPVAADCSRSSPFRSGRVDRQPSGALQWGRVEVSARVPAEMFAWPAVWMVPLNQKYRNRPASGEIDLLEVGCTPPNAPSHTLPDLPRHYPPCYHLTLQV